MLNNDSFIRLINRVRNPIAKVLSLVLVGVIFVFLVQLITILSINLLAGNFWVFDQKSLREFWNLFLNLLIALELLKSITAYLKKRKIQVKFLLVTALITISQKIITFDLTQYQTIDVLFLALASVAIAVSYYLIGH